MSEYVVVADMPEHIEMKLQFDPSAALETSSFVRVDPKDLRVIGGGKMNRTLLPCEETQMHVLSEKYEGKSVLIEPMEDVEYAEGTISDAIADAMAMIMPGTPSARCGALPALLLFHEVNKNLVVDGAIRIYTREEDLLICVELGSEELCNYNAWISLGDLLKNEHCLDHPAEIDEIVSGLRSLTAIAERMAKDARAKLRPLDMPRVRVKMGRAIL